MEQMERMKELVQKLNLASRAYYQEDYEIMSNMEYDRLYDELQKLECTLGITLSNSPTIHVGYEVMSELAKEAHSSPMLSLDKTKDVEALKDWLGDQKGILSWKLDGLTVVLTYRDGILVKAVTRGNGEVGEVITNNAKTFCNIPNRIPYTGELIVRGEAVIKYSDFNRINDAITDVAARYKNPRNLCSGTVRQLNNAITAERNVHFFAFNLVEVSDVDFQNSIANRFAWLTGLGFDVVEHTEVTRNTLADTVMQYATRIIENDFPSDGLVLIYDNVDYGKGLGTTAKYPRDSIAFKWADELATTHLQSIEWSPSRTGLINPVAVFEPVELEGTSVSRASLHNVSILEAYALGEGDEITVYKANMIIPQLAENLTRSGKVMIPKQCPACYSPTEIRNINGAKTLYCTNEFCSAKKIKSFAHYVSRNAMNIDGLSDATLEKFIEQGYLVNLQDIYQLSNYKKDITVLEGFGLKSYENLVAAIDKSRDTTSARLLYALGILNIGAANAKLICRSFQDDFVQVRNATYEQLIEIEGIGDVIARVFVDYFKDPQKNAMIDAILKEVTLHKETQQEQTLSGITFVITGSVNKFQNRDEIKALIEAKGGKVTGTVSAKTQYLINNDLMSNSSKNKKAKKLGIPILSEDDFLALLDEL